MDEALEAVELAADAGIEGIVSWVFRLAGLLCILAGLGLWLLGDAGFLWLPAVMLVVGVVLAAAPSVLFAAVELFG